MLDDGYDLVHKLLRAVSLVKLISCVDPAGLVRRVHSRYQRMLADLPCSRYAVRLRLSMRKLFCDNPRCTRRIFTECLPEVVAPWARRTVRLAKRLTAVGLALGGSADTRLAQGLGMPTTRNTLLRLIRAAPLLLVVSHRRCRPQFSGSATGRGASGTATAPC